MPSLGDCPFDPPGRECREDKPCHRSAGAPVKGRGGGMSIVHRKSGEPLRSGRHDVAERVWRSQPHLPCVLRRSSVASPPRHPLALARPRSSAERPRSRGGSAGASADFAAAYDNTEVEPQVAVNPTNPNEIIGVAQQDRWPDGAARGLSSWISHNGGATWAKLGDAPWSACQGGPARFGRVTDPWVSYDRAGNAYFIGQPIDVAENTSAVSVTTFDRSSGTWRSPTILIEEGGDRGVKRGTGTADPWRPTSSSPATSCATAPGATSATVQGASVCRSPLPACSSTTCSTSYKPPAPDSPPEQPSNSPDRSSTETVLTTIHDAIFTPPNQAARMLRRSVDRSAPRAGRASFQG